MAYTPELNNFYSTTLRRIAWAIDEPMTETIRRVIDHVVGQVNHRLVCEKCRDNSRCELCAFQYFK